MSEMAMVLQQLDKMQKSIDGLRGDLDAKLQENTNVLRTEMCEMREGLHAEMDNLRTELTERMENVETGLTGLTERMENVETGLTGLTERMENVETGLTGLTERMENVEGRLDELTQNVNNAEYGLGQEIQAVYALAQQNGENIRQLMPYKSGFINICMMGDRVEHLEECQKVTTDVVASHSEAIRRLESKLA